MISYILYKGAVEKVLLRVIRRQGLRDTQTSQCSYLSILSSKIEPLLV